MHQPPGKSPGLAQCYHALAGYLQLLVSRAMCGSMSLCVPLRQAASCKHACTSPNEARLLFASKPRSSCVFSHVLHAALLREAWDSRASVVHHLNVSLRIKPVWSEQSWQGLGLGPVHNLSSMLTHHWNTLLLSAPRICLLLTLLASTGTAMNIIQLGGFCSASYFSICAPAVVLPSTMLPWRVWATMLSMCPTWWMTWPPSLMPSLSKTMRDSA